MEPVLRVKRKRTDALPDSSMCLFCQAGDKKTLRLAKHDSVVRVQECLNQRRKYDDNSNLILLSRLENIEDWSVPYMWHKSCYSSFTSLSKIQRLRVKHNRNRHVDIQNIESKRPERATLSRSSTELTELNLCIFCQTVEHRTELRNVAIFDTSEKILKEANHDIELCIRLANVNDLIASEAKYHLSCYSDFLRRSLQCHKDGKTNDRSFNELIQELKTALLSGNIYSMDVVWKRYQAIVEMFGDKPRPKYISRRASFKDDITKALGDDVTFVRPWDQAKPLLIHHSALPNIAIANAFSRTEDNTDLNSILTSSPEDEFTRSLVHVMLKIRNDMKSTLGHQSWKGIDKEHVQQVVPESLLVMLHLLFQGDVALVDSDIKKRTEKQWIYSIAQDLVYGVSGGKKLTPKHIGLGMTVHQMTRSKQLIDILHAACHSISYEMVRRIDTSIASHVLEKFKDNDNVYIPECIQPGVFAHFAADNIDILEETLDGKNTFHPTQMAMWQRGRIEPDHSEVLIGKEKVLNRSLVDDIHKIETVQMPVNKPLPILQGCFSCDNGQGVKQHEDSRHKDIAWLLSRIECESDQHVPGWSGFNRSLSTTVHELSSTGFLPIIQHPAHEYDTLNSVILRCLSI